ncbi:MAG: ferrous iron transport protein B [Acidilobaceae archaeon]|nr:ferrous iron transport protein B [Acidilobaceae archaeon]MDW7974201.1 ferrous iron transport protein B [Sulfolobales archaeon]
MINAAHHHGTNSPGEKERPTLRVGIIGFPNVGKSALFNSLTGGEARVANWPGTTVDIHYGLKKFGRKVIEFVDLPGVYSLGEGGPIGDVVKTYLLLQRPDVVLVLVDGTNVERTLNLAVQVAEVSERVVVAITKVDLAHSRGIHINAEGLSRALGRRVVPTSVTWGLGLEELLMAIVEVAEGEGQVPLKINYGPLEPYVRELSSKLEPFEPSLGVNSRWVAVKLLEGDPFVEKIVGEKAGELLNEAREMRAEISKTLGKEPLGLIAETRFRYSLSLASGNIVRSGLRLSRTERLDRMTLDPRLSPFISAAAILTLFLFAFSLNTGFPLNVVLSSLGFEQAATIVDSYNVAALMERFIGYGTSLLEPLLEGRPAWLRSLLLDGVIGGISVALLFAPLIFTVSAFLAVLEDSGLAPRFAYSLHPYTCRVGLSGHSLFPAVSCFGCNVGGLMAVRGTPSLAERVKLYLILPLLPCQARLIVFLALAAAVGSVLGVLGVVMTYVISVTLVAVLSYVLDRFYTRSSRPIMLMDIPNLHMPLRRVAWWMAWSTTRHFLYRTGTIIFLGALLTWVLSSFTPSLQYTPDPSESIAAHLSRVLVPLFAPLGIEGEKAWMTVYGLIAGFVAKEIYLSSLAVITGIENPIEAVSFLSLSEASLLALMVFIALYVPCLGTISVIYTETRSVRVALTALVLSLVTGYLTAIAVYHFYLILLSIL